jgi:uncharacterized protein YbjT (DUF2867 family)
MVDGGKNALVAGCSGLVGMRLLPLLLNAGEYTRVHALSRRPLILDHARLANRVVRFEEPLEAQLTGLRCLDAFCCLGTTLRAAGSKSAFRQIDLDLVVRFARFALGAGAERFVLISSVGADPGSRNFYLRVKGESEQALQALHFRALDILAPSVLLGTRRVARPLESLAQAAMWLLSPLMLGQWTAYRAIAADAVAAAMLGAARSGRRGVNRYSYDGIRALAAASMRNSARL